MNVSDVGNNVVQNDIILPNVSFSPINIEQSFAVAVDWALAHKINRLKTENKNLYYRANKLMGNGKKRSFLKKYKNFLFGNGTIAIELKGISLKIDENLKDFRDLSAIQSEFLRSYI